MSAEVVPNPRFADQWSFQVAFHTPNPVDANQKTLLLGAMKECKTIIGSSTEDNYLSIHFSMGGGWAYDLVGEARTKLNVSFCQAYIMRTSVTAVFATPIRGGNEDPTQRLDLTDYYFNEELDRDVA